jgi:hypothetical protein
LPSHNISCKQAPLEVAVSSLAVESGAAALMSPYWVGDPEPLTVVDTGPWIFGKKVLLPAGTINRVDADGGKLYVDLTKEQIKDSPEFDRAPITNPTTAAESAIITIPSTPGIDHSCTMNGAGPGRSGRSGSLSDRCLGPQGHIGSQWAAFPLSPQWHSRRK